MRRTLIGLLLVFHGLAHSALGFWAASLGPTWLVTPLWWIAEVGFVAAGAGLIGVTGLRRLWAPVAFAAGLCSIAMFSLYGHLALMIGLVLDVFILVVALQWGEPAAIARLRGRAVPPDLHPRRHAIATWLTAAALAYMSSVILLRPWQLQWGSTREDRVASLPGDQVVELPQYRMDRVVTIHAPADSVWPWLERIGQDRARFYNDDRLERMIGADVERGWRVAEIVPGRAIVIEQRGAFVLEPVDAATTKLHIRLLGDGTPTLSSALRAPFGLFVSEPAHFFRERGMMLGIKRRAEQAAPHSAA